MKKILFYALVGTLLVTACNSGKKSENPSQEQEVIAKPTPPKSKGFTRILFVGNSHTEYFASFPKMLEALAKENGKPVEVFSLLGMGVGIDEILSSNKKQADDLFTQTDTDGNYFDYVILQESTPIALQEEEKYKKDCKLINDSVLKNSPGVATYIYELMMPVENSDPEFTEYQKILSNNALDVAKSLPNTGVLRFATALNDAYKGKEGYVAIKDGKDNLRHTDNSKHMLNDAVFLNSIILYQNLFGETPKIPKQLPLATGTGEQDEIKLMNVEQGVSNPDALIKIAVSYK